ncbi:UBP-type zinc finger domain-containing protein [Kitasatospora cathayae]|uniref:UBP-type zinc finger domain-containing protein n=1 Tax=Kitasatospora cathayae TaxID=3004092 RepID=A0ABY7PXI2_9ACTN|nr:UBP-type zinc finger domain-containing protein [Kitasatospora sp. HUAS 3-15]WBP85157.1 UBP-type zinc finger domain-containing protein [Kitasatospora sp. HUAS 3-15]
MLTCSHLDAIAVEPVEPTDSAEPASCRECLATGAVWVHLRRCLTCGRIGCCDSSTNKHASRHYEATGHPLIASHQPGEGWIWCFPDRLLLDSVE